jgi:ribosomal protein L24E
MILELIEEINPGNGTMYAVVADGYTIRWFSQKVDAEAYYELVLNDPSKLKNEKNILKSQEIELPSDK